MSRVDVPPKLAIVKRYISALVGGSGGNFFFVVLSNKFKRLIDKMAIDFLIRITLSNSYAHSVNFCADFPSDWVKSINHRRIHYKLLQRSLCR